jgi:hypothetical protein
MAGAKRLVGMRRRAAAHERFAARHSQVFQLGEDLMEGTTQPTRIAGPRPGHNGAIERARDRIIDERRGDLYYRVTIIA